MVILMTLVQGCLTPLTVLRIARFPFRSGQWLFTYCARERWKKTCLCSTIQPVGHSEAFEMWDAVTAEASVTNPHDLSPICMYCTGNSSAGRFSDSSSETLPGIRTIPVRYGSFFLECQQLQVQRQKANVQCRLCLLLGVLSV
jgi:hypothetical protein